MLHDRVVLSPLQNKPMPIYAESIGYNPNQERLSRPQGYPTYHWLQTIRGEGSISIEGNTISLCENSGVLLSPHMTHSYHAITDTWQTAYFTFDGRMIADLLEHIGLKTDAIYCWETESLINVHIVDLVDKVKQTEDTFGIITSTYVYQFLLTINNYAGLQKNPDVSERIELLQPLIHWMKINISNPNIGISEFASYVGVSSRRLNTLFQETFNISPYAYFLNLRIRKAKQILFNSEEITIKSVSKEVGFRSVSHFIATFKRIVGLSPEHFRRLH